MNFQSKMYDNDTSRRRRHRTYRGICVLLCSVTVLKSWRMERDRASEPNKRTNETNASCLLVLDGSCLYVRGECIRHKMKLNGNRYFESSIHGCLTHVNLIIHKIHKYLITFLLLLCCHSFTVYYVIMIFRQLSASRRNATSTPTKHPNHQPVH